MSKKKVKRTKGKAINPVERFKKRISKYIVLTESHDYIDFIFGVIYANRLDVKPIWAYVIGPSSCGKTLMLDPMDGHASIVALDTLSKASLLPGIKPGRPTKNSAKMAAKNSVLSRANGKILVIKDMSPLLTEDYKELKSILGVLRSAYDGKFSKAFGNIGQIEIECKFGFIAAVTDAIDRHSIVDSELGQRFIGYRMPAISLKEERAICDAIRMNKESELDEALHEAVCEMLDRQPKEPEITKRQADAIMYATEIIALARTSISRDKFTHDPRVSRPERAARLYSQLISLAKGVAMARGHRRVMGEDVVFVRHVAAHTLSLDMLRLLNMFLNKGVLTAQKLQDRFKWCVTTCHRTLENLELIGITEKEVIAGSKGRDVDAWTLKRADQWEKMLKKLDYDICYGGVESRRGKDIKF